MCNFACTLNNDEQMKYAIIAAGEGSRLAAEGIIVPKPLVEVGGEKLIDRLIRIFMANEAEEIVVICNDRTARVSQHLAGLQRDGLAGCHVPLRFIVKSTPSSMHSFFEISRYLSDGPFCMTTVDTIFREADFAAYIKAFKEEGCDGLMGVTDYIDDERPLYVQTDGDMNILGFHDAQGDAQENCKYISAGIYGLHPNAIYTLDNCIARSEHRMRNFQRGLVRDGRRLKAYAFSKVLDIDHAEDVAKAEEFLKSE